MGNFAAQKSLLLKFFERRQAQMFEKTRHGREVVAARRAADGTVNSGAFVTDVTAIFVSDFAELARGLTKELLDLFDRSQIQIDSESAKWVKAELEPLLDMAAMNLRASAGDGQVMRHELAHSVNQGIEKALAEAKRDLQIDLDVRQLTKAEAVPVTALIDEALMDVLVPLQNRRGFEQAFDAEDLKANEPLSLVLFDIDHFKDVNDKNGGHAVGDEALKSIAVTATACTRGKGKAFRFGGDEFVLLLSNHTLSEALAVAERLRVEMNAVPRTSKELMLSVSVGVASFPEHGSDVDSLLKAADAALYDAKKHNRNVVRYYDEPEPSASATREVARKQPEPGGWSEDQQTYIRQEYFRKRIAHCPKDLALLNVQNITGFGESRTRLLVSCPMCGLAANL